MVLVLSCHPFVSKKAISPSSEPVECLISENWILVSTVDHATEIYRLVGEDCTLQTTIKNTGEVKQAIFCPHGKCLITVEEIRTDTGVHVYHRFSESDTEVKPGQRSFTVSTDVTPTSIASCSLTGNLAIGGNETIQISRLVDERRLNGQSAISYEPFMNVHVSYLTTHLMDIHANFLAVSSKREAHILYIPSLVDCPREGLPAQYGDAINSVLPPSILSEEMYYHRKNEIHEMLGPSCIAPRTAVLAQREDQSGSSSPERVLHLFYKLLTERQPDYHTVQLIPKYDPGGPSNEATITTVHCFVSSTKEGYLYQLYPTVQLHSHYHYTAPSPSVSIGDDFLFAATDQGLDTYSHRVNAAFISEMERTSGEKACPSPTHDICLVSMKPFYGLQCLDSSQNKVVMLSKVKGNDHRRLSDDAWSIYILEGATSADIFDDIIDFGLHSNQMNPELYLQGLIEGHLLLRSKVIQRARSEPEDQLLDCYRTSCKLLGEFYARDRSSDSHLALSYFEMAEVTLEEAWKLCYKEKQIPAGNTEDPTISKGLLCFFEAAVFSEKMCQNLSQECLSSVLDLLLQHDPALCSEVVLAPHLQDRIDMNQADEVLKELKKRLMHGQTYHWSTLDFIAVINIYLMKGEMEQALATFDLIYEDELVDLCSEREDLIILRDKEQFTNLGGMMCRFPSAIVSILINLTETGRIEYLDVCKIIKKNSGDWSDVIMLEYLESIVSRSTVGPCEPFHTDAMEKLIQLYIECLISEASTGGAKKKKSVPVTKHQKNNSRHTWLNRLPPFEGSDVTTCQRISLPINVLPTNQDYGLWFKRDAASLHLRQAKMDAECHCLDCHLTLVKLQELLTGQRCNTVNAPWLLEQCRKVPEERGRFSLEVLCLCHTSQKEAFELVFSRDLALVIDFVQSMVPLDDQDTWRHIVSCINRKPETQGRQAKLYQDCLNDVLNYLLSRLCPDDFQVILSETELNSESVKTFSRRLQEERKLRHLKEDIMSSLAVLVKS